MPILFLILTALVLALQIRSRARGQGRLEASLELSKDLVEPGEQTELIVTVSNRARTLVPFLKLNIRLPRGVTAASTEKLRHMKLIDADEIVMSTWAAPMQRLRLRVPVFAERRGRYLFESVAISEGDFLGLKERRDEFRVFTELIVVPREAPKRMLRQIPGSFPGDLSVKRFLFEDPVLTVGCREYTGSEPMKSIAWSASARVGSLMVKQYDHTMDASVVVVLNVFTSAEDPENRAEDCFSLTRTACRMLEDRGIKYSVFTDASSGADSGSRYVGEGLGGRHFARVLELLGRSGCYGQGTFVKLLDRAVGQTHGVCGILLITPASDRDILSAAGRAAAKNGVGLVTLMPEEAG